MRLISRISQFFLYLSNKFAQVVSFTGSEQAFSLTVSGRGCFF